MADLDLNEPINWDDLEDFVGEACELAGDFFFEVESDEDEDSDEENRRRMDLGNGRGRGTLGLTGLRQATPWSSFMFHGESSSVGHGHGPLFVGESSSMGRRHGPLFVGESSSMGRRHGPLFVGESSSAGRGHARLYVGESSGEARHHRSSGDENEPAAGGVRGRLGLSGRGRGSCPPFRGNGRATAAPGRGAAVAGRASAVRGGRGRARSGRGRGAAAGAGHGVAGAGRGAAGGGHGAPEGGEAAGDDHEEGGQDNGIVPLGRLVNSRRVYSDDDKRKIYASILRRTSMDALCNGVTKAVTDEFMVPLRVVQRVWLDAQDGVEYLVSKKPMNCGRKRIDFDPEAITQIPPSKRTTLKDLAHELGVSKTTLWRRFKEKMFRRHTNAIKPRITDANKKSRVEYALSMVDMDSLLARFKDMYDVIFIDEKWFYKTKGSQNYYLVLEEEEPFRSCQSKHYIDKIMFLCAVARPKFDADGNCTFDGKIGMWPFVTEKPVERGSHNRLRGTLETKPLNVTRAVSRWDIRLVEKVLPAIKEKWPLEDRWSTIYIQQDNAKTHVLPNDHEFVEAAKRGGWDIRLTCQPPNSPDTNILDLGLFAALQSLFQKKSPTSIVDVLTKVQQAWNEYPVERSNRVFLTHQCCMVEIMRLLGEHRYKIPHKHHHAREAVVVVLLHALFIRLRPALLVHEHDAGITLNAVSHVLQAICANMVSELHGKDVAPALDAVAHILQAALAQHGKDAGLAVTHVLHTALAKQHGRDAALAIVHVLQAALAQQHGKDVALAVVHVLQAALAQQHWTDAALAVVNVLQAALAVAHVVHAALAQQHGKDATLAVLQAALAQRHERDDALAVIVVQAALAQQHGKDATLAVLQAALAQRHERDDALAVIVVQAALAQQHGKDATLAVLQAALAQRHERDDALAVIVVQAALAQQHERDDALAVIVVQAALAQQHGKNATLAVAHVLHAALSLQRRKDAALALNYGKVAALAQHHGELTGARTTAPSSAQLVHAHGKSCQRRERHRQHHERR